MKWCRRYALALTHERKQRRGHVADLLPETERRLLAGQTLRDIAADLNAHRASLSAAFMTAHGMTSTAWLERQGVAARFTTPSRAGRSWSCCG
jgi:hypothetical protein